MLANMNIYNIYMNKNKYFFFGHIFRHNHITSATITGAHAAPNVQFSINIRYDISGDMT